MPSWLHHAYANADAVRRFAGAGMDALGLGPEETPFQIAADLQGARLRSYAGAASSGRALLIIPAPFKRPYIWDIAPDVSVIRKFCGRGFGVHLIEWQEPAQRLELQDYALRIPRAAIDLIAAQTGRDKVVLAGHSLGGTLAAIFAAVHGHLVEKLLLIEAPLVFGNRGGPLSRAVRMAPSGNRIAAALGHPVPGAAINAMSVLAAPDAFFWRPMLDLAMSACDPAALALHLRVRRWTLDELAMPGGVFAEVWERLYRCDRLASGGLRLRNQTASLARLISPTLAIADPCGRIVPARSMLDGLSLAPAPVTVLRYRAESGTMLDHVAALAGPRAHATLWPRALELLGS